MEIKATTRRWGDSIAVVIPSDVAKRERIGVDEEIVVRVERKRPLAGAMFGRFPELKKFSTQALKDEARKGWESKSDRRRWRK